MNNHLRTLDIKQPQYIGGSLSCAKASEVSNGLE